MATGGRRHAFETMRSAVNSKLLYASNATSDLIMTGVLERYPRLTSFSTSTNLSRG